MSKSYVDRWHEVFLGGDISRLDEVLHDEVTFHSPVVHTPQSGKKLTQLYLTAANKVLNNGSFKYVRTAEEGQFCLMEFETEVDGIVVNGVDMISWNDDNKIIDFKVMVRPLKAIQAVHPAMGAALEEMIE